MRIWIVALASVSIGEQLLPNAGAQATAQTIEAQVSCRVLLARIVDGSVLTAEQVRVWVFEAFDANNPWPEIERISVAHSLRYGMTPQASLQHLLPSVLEASARFDPAYDPSNLAPLKIRFRNFVVASAGAYSASARHNLESQVSTVYSQRAHYRLELDFLNLHTGSLNEKLDWNGLVSKYQLHRQEHAKESITNNTARKRLQKALALRDSRAPVSLDASTLDVVSQNMVSNVPMDYSLKPFVEVVRSVVEDAKKSDPRSIVVLKLKLFGFSNEEVGSLIGGVTRTVPSNMMLDLEKSLSKRSSHFAAVLRNLLNLARSDAGRLQLQQVLPPELFLTTQEFSWLKNNWRGSDPFPLEYEEVGQVSGLVSRPLPKLSQRLPKTLQKKESVEPASNHIGN